MALSQMRLHILYRHIVDENITHMYSTQAYQLNYNTVHTSQMVNYTTYAMRDVIHIYTSHSHCIQKYITQYSYIVHACQRIENGTVYFFPLMK